jgi:hypothetical protein
MLSPQLIAALLLISNLAAAADIPIFSEARPVPELNALFEQKDDWIGGDGAYSVALTPERTLWLFSDTWIGSVRGGRRTNSALVNNTLAVQERHGANSKLQFIVRHDDHGKPTAFWFPKTSRVGFGCNPVPALGSNFFCF